MKTLITIAIIFFSINVFAQSSVTVDLGGTGGSGGGGDFTGWNLSGGNTGVAFPDSSAYVGTNNATSLRLKTGGVTHFLMDSMGMVTLQDTAQVQLRLKRNGVFSEAGALYIGDVGHGGSVSGQNPGDNVRFFRLTGVGAWSRNLKFNDYEFPDAPWRLENNGNGAYIELGHDGPSLWAAPDGVAGASANLSRLLVASTVNANVGIGTGGIPTACAKLEILSTTKGLLLPRMTKAQRDAISSPTAGLMIYQTDNTPGLRTYNGTNWMKYTESTD